MLKKNLLIIIFLLFTFNFYGCWNNVDLTTLGISSAIGIDTSSEKKLKVSVQIVNPAGVRSSASK